MPAQPQKQQLAFLARYYGKPIEKKRMVEYAPPNKKPRQAWIVRADRQYLRLHFVGEEKPDKGRYHPTWCITYLNASKP